MQTPPLSWLKNVHDELKLAGQIPLWGAPPDFPWKEMSHALEQDLQLPDFSLTLRSQDIKKPKDFLLGMGQKPFIKTFEMSPIEGEIFWIISNESMKKVTESVLFSEDKGLDLSSPELQEGFFEYLLLCASQTFSNHSPFPDLQIQWNETKPLPQEPSFCLQLTLTTCGQSFPCHLVFAPRFQKGFKHHFSQTPPDLLSSKLTETLELPLDLSIGSSELKQSEWDKVKVGDWVLLDSCSYDPKARKGSLTLSYRDAPLFRVKIKNDKLKILDYCQHNFEEKSMDEESYFDEIPELDPEKSPTDSETLDSEIETDLEIDLQDDESELPDLETLPEKSPEVKQTLSSSLDLSFPISVEVSQVSMPLKKILNLEPGNILELPIKVEEGVYLCVRGKKIARGELVKIGEALGVKIVELSESS